MFFHRGVSRTPVTSTMGLFVALTNGFQPFTNVTKNSILDAASVLDPFLIGITLHWQWVVCYLFLEFWELPVNEMSFQFVLPVWGLSLSLLLTLTFSEVEKHKRAIYSPVIFHELRFSNWCIFYSISQHGENMCGRGLPAGNYMFKVNNRNTRTRC